MGAVKDLPAGLAAAAERLGVCLDDRQRQLLEVFVGLLEQWNTRFNLLSRQDIGRVWSRHVLDSLSLLPLMPPGRVLDVGTGAGFPGMPLAIAAPDRRVHLVDRNARKIRFLEFAVHRLGITNAVCVCGDVADLPTSERFEAIVSRAVADEATLWALTHHLLAPDGRLILMTGAGGDSRSERIERSDGGLDTGIEDAGEASDDVSRLEGGRIERRCEVEIPGLDRPHEVTIIAARAAQPGS